MSTWAEEYRRGTLDLLKSLPLTLTQLVFFKALGIYLIFFALVLTTLPFLAMILPLANFEGGVITTQMLGVVLLGLSQLSFGILISALSRNQILAYLGTLFAFLLLLMSHAILSLVDPHSWLSLIFRFFSLEAHFNSFNRGVFSSSDFLYFILVSALFLILTKAVLERQKER
jgi:ABC-2 type transport system permease protein